MIWKRLCSQWGMVPRRELGESMCKIRKVNTQYAFFVTLLVADDPGRVLLHEAPHRIARAKKNNLIKSYIQYSSVFFYQASKAAGFDISFLKLKNYFDTKLPITNIQFSERSVVRNEHFGVTSLTVKIAAIYNLTLVSHCSFINFLFLKTLIIIKLIVIGNAHPHIHICTRIYVCILIRWRGNVESSQMPESPSFN